MTDPAITPGTDPQSGTPPHAAAHPAPAPAEKPQITEFDADQPQHAAAPVGFAALLGVLGVVYGDIGTSPLYAFRSTVEVISGHHSVAPWEIMGVASLIFWTLLLIVTVKYVILIMRADHNGEGGILAIMSLAQRMATSPKTRWALGLVGIVGACLFFGDGIITPAISVLSAIEGVEVSVPAAHDFVIPIAILVIISLFSVQWIGTGKVGTIFGPVMLLWFGTIGALGVVQILHHPGILMALSPTYALEFVFYHGKLSFLALGAVVLCVTGAEALYADMGHFGRAPIRYAWLFFVLPMLVLNYFGQAALVIADPKALVNPFFLMCPHWMQGPMVVLSTFATVIASQAGISGGFSVCRQLIQLGYMPRLRMTHTNAEEEGQIYLPDFNRFLAVGAVLLVVAFRSSDALASAYGIAVTGTFICTSILAIVVFRKHFNWPAWQVGLVFGSFLALDATFFAANALKIPDGGWVPVMLGCVLTLMMTTWKKGRSLIVSRQRQDSLPMGSFIARLPQSRIIRVPGMAVFMTGTPDFVPPCLLHNLRHNKILHDHVLFVTVQNLDQPEADRGHRVAVEELAPNIYRVILRYGFMEMPNIPRALEDLKSNGVDFDALQASYFTSRELITRSSMPRISHWRMSLFLFMARNSTSSMEFFRIPPDRVVQLGVKVAI
ncbi:potassium transporter Kup [Acetobacter orleanensis]|uniref:Probable potassium transport system protein Kup n=1 Tax=Acetobacter orleanensis TaxID=104099 RepID=A0A4Y3TPF6_9PROT|nr:potassium transporter Kup [Acetobacter orleanensis]KXV65884.1 potassium transporter Kup [Acetobacter orleanensis]PCD79784.1 potassium transporter Kup [Acetobacter orleanensis]GAN69093.1 potassium transporter Kup system [Acetobacter orleanensis JCM 7639]GBR28527.1 potassium transporter Kup system [Acetobacter orleanensis NRIC 0473]GEB83623.1 putative potassium transport system protein kup [Acetobacter orleanensis]